MCLWAMTRDVMRTRTMERGAENGTESHDVPISKDENERSQSSDFKIRHIP